MPLGDAERSFSIANPPSQGSEQMTRLCQPGGILMVQPHQNGRRVREKNDPAVGVTVLIVSTPASGKGYLKTTNQLIIATQKLVSTTGEAA